MQPHTPFIPCPEVNGYYVAGPGSERGGEGLHQDEKFIPELIEEHSYEKIWNCYIDNLRYVLDDVKTLLSNIDAEKVIISADHGEALGERGQWSHYWGSTLDCLRNVPWCETSASDSGEYVPDYNPEEITEDGVSVDDKLRYLGYKPD